MKITDVKHSLAIVMLIGGTSCPFVAQKQNKVPACLVARIAYIPLPEIKSTPHSYHRWTCHDCHTSTMFPLSMAISIERIDLTAQVPIHIPLNLACKQTDRCLVPRSAKATKTHYGLFFHLLFSLLPPSLLSSR